jgi:polyferredoxin
MLMGLVFTIATALLGPRVGSHNFAIIIVWIAWWTTLKLGFIPLGGRSWCSICPIPLPGEWLQHGGIMEKRESLDKLPDKNSWIVRYCLSGRMSGIAAQTLVGFGYSNIFSLVGGIDAR